MAKFKVLLTEPIHSQSMEFLKKNDTEIVFPLGIKPEQICGSVGDVDAIIVRGPVVRLDAKIMDHAPQLKVIGRTGVGVDNVDVSGATNRGIFVVYTPKGPVEAVAEYVAMALVALPRRILQADTAVRSGDWNFRNRERGPELLGKILGIVGFGRIGRRISEICSLGFRMRVMYSDPVPASVEEEKRLNAPKVHLDELISNSDFISITLPLLDSTYHLIGERELNMMQPHAYLINCSRGAVIDEPALINALQSRRIAGAVIDVFENEPVSGNNPLLKLDNVLLSPHCAGLSIESDQKISMVVVDIIRVLNGQKPEFPVNAPQMPRQPVL